MYIREQDLDFFLVSRDIQAITRKCFIESGYRTDHNLIILEMNEREWKRGKGFWKLNTSLLSDNQYIELVKETVRETVNRYEDKEGLKSVDDQTLWEMIKMEVRGKTIQYSSRKKWIEKEREDRLISEIKCLSEKLDQEDEERKVTHTKTYRSE